ncbi:MAG: PQQ-dependent sugar dehydrogenase [Burkholderiales bacterium]
MNRISRNLLAALATCIVFTVPAAAQSVVQSTALEKVRVVTLTKGLEHPWSLAFLPDGRMLVTERPGRLRIVGSDGRLVAQPVAGVPAVVERGQGGLLDVALHPDFRRNGVIFLSYTGAGPGGYSTEVARARLVETQGAARLEDVKVIFRQEPRSSTSRHFGSRLVFDRQGLLYVTLGDRGEQDRAQKTDDLAGKIVRITEDGGVPADNPFRDQPGARPEVYSLGNRNVQGAALHPQTGVLWAHEHGPQGGDEVNVIRAGTNYGWPVITYGVNYVIGTKIGEGTEKPGMAQPVWKWVPSIAPSGMAFYEGGAFPEWRGNLFVGALKDQMLVRLELDDEKVVKEERMLNDIGRVRDVRSGPDGFLYLLIDDSDGALLRIEPAR